MKKATEHSATIKFDKELFKRSVLYNIKTLYRKTMEEASEQQLFKAVSYAIKDAVVDHWLTTHEEYEKQDPKTVYYLVHGISHGACPRKQYDKYEWLYT
jgi:glycogen phosphorylase